MLVCTCMCHNINVVILCVSMFRMAQPAIRSYDKMFEVEEEEQLSGGRDGEGGNLLANQDLLGAPTP